MIKKVSRNEMRLERHKRIRKDVVGTTDRPRLCVFRANANISAQIINDELGVTLVSASTNEKELNIKNGGNVEAAKLIGAELAKRAKEVIAIEQDSNICKILSRRLKEEKIDNVELINEDALKIEFPKFNKIVSNLPYQISSPITFKFLDYDFDLAVLMYQKEFALRMNGEVGSKNYSRLAAMLYFKCNVEKLTDVSCESFIPKPKVDSTVIKLTPKESTVTNEDFECYSKFTKALFQHRNKKIRNALIDSRHIVSNLDKKEIKKRLKSIENEELIEYLSKRVIVLTPEEILFISKELNPIFND